MTAHLSPATGTSVSLDKLSAGHFAYGGSKLSGHLALSHPEDHSNFTPTTNAGGGRRARRGSLERGLRLRGDRHLDMMDPASSLSPFQDLAILAQPEHVLIRARGNDNRFMTCPSDGVLMRTISYRQLCGAVFRIQDYVDQDSGLVVSTIFNVSSRRYLAVSPDTQDVIQVGSAASLGEVPPNGTMALNGPSVDLHQPPHSANSTSLSANSTSRFANSTNHFASSTNHVANSINRFASSTSHPANSTNHFASSINHSANSRLTVNSPTTDLRPTLPSISWDAADISLGKISGGDISLGKVSGGDISLGKLFGDDVDLDFVDGPPHPCCLFVIISNSHTCFRPALSPQHSLSYRQSDGRLTVVKGRPWVFSLHSAPDACHFFSRSDMRRLLRKAVLVVLFVQGVAD